MSAPSQQNAAAPLHGQVALITGGTDGIGKQTALRLAELGAELVLVGRTAEKGQRAVAELQAHAPGSKVAFWQYDLSLMHCVHALADAVQAQYPHLDMLV